MKIIENYRKYKWFFTSSKKLVVGGKNALQNDELMRIIKKQKEDLFVMHTSSPGSPFSVILDSIINVNKNDLEETAIFTACFSQAWKSGKKFAEVDIFKSSQLSKPSSVKIGTWQVKGDIDRVIVPLELFLVKQEGVLRAVPEKSAKNPFLKIIPGNITKDLIYPKIQLEVKTDLNQKEILSSLPAGGIKTAKIK